MSKERNRIVEILFFFLGLCYNWYIKYGDNMKLNDKQKILGVFAVLSLVLIAVGVSVAFFTYSKDGSTENTIKSGSITFLYDEINQSGNNIGIVDALPISDTVGKAGTNYFNFKIVSTASTTTSIPYEITLRQKEGTDNIGNKVKVYLSKISSYNSAVNTEEEVQTSLFSSLQTVTHNNYSEKILHTDIVPASDQRYEQYYRLKMWLDETTDLTSSDYVDKTFTVTVNVYSNGHVLDASSSNNNITSLSVGGTQLTVASTENNIDYYEATLPEGTTQTTITVETSDYTRTKITKTQSDYQTPIASSNNITKLSNTLNKTVNVTDGANYFKIITISEDGTEKESHMLIKVRRAIALQGLAKNIYDNAIDSQGSIYTNPTLTATSATANENGLYSMEVTDGFGGTDGITYFFRGNVTDNYVDFVGFTWRIVRVNEDGTVRLILDDSTDTKKHKFRTAGTGNASYVYFSSSSVKMELAAWLENSIVGGDLEKIAIGNYFCEAAKVKYSSSVSGGVPMIAWSSYTPDLKCENDFNEKGLVNSNIGLMTYDELVLAGSRYDTTNTNQYLYKNYLWWTMSPASYESSTPRVWRLGNNGEINRLRVDNGDNHDVRIRPVINLKADVIASGSGTSADPYVIQ